MSKLKKSLIRIALAALLLVVIVWVAYPTAKKLYLSNTDSAYRAEKRVSEFVLAETKPEHRKYHGEYVFRAGRLGTGSWIVFYASGMVTPAWPNFCLIDRGGKIFHMSAEALSAIMRVEFQPTSSDSDHDDFIERFIRLLHHERFEILDQQNLERYAEHPKKPFTADLVAKINLPEKKGDGSYVFFTYQEIGGYVRRYEFRYDPDGAFQECLVEEIASRVGPYSMYL